MQRKRSFLNDIYISNIFSDFQNMQAAISFCDERNRFAMESIITSIIFEALFQQKLVVADESLCF